MSTTIMADVDPRIRPAELTASNPLDALLPEAQLGALSRMTAAKKHEFYGRVMASVFADPSYQKMVFDIANREFAQVSGGAAPSSDLKSVVEEVVASVLKARGIG